MRIFIVFIMLIYSFSASANPKVNVLNDINYVLMSGVKQSSSNPDLSIGTLTKCLINSQNAFTDCAYSKASENRTANFAFSPKTKKLYSVDTSTDSYAKTVRKCTLSPTTQVDFLSDCSDIGSVVSNNIARRPYGVTIHSDKFLYFIMKNGTLNNQNKGILKCPLNVSGDITACTGTGDAPLTQPRSLTFSSDSQYAYISDVGKKTIYRCSYNESTGELSSCTGVYNSGNAWVYSIALSPTNNSVYLTALVGNEPGSVFIKNCLIGSNGAFSPCKVAHVFSRYLLDPRSLVLDSTNNFLYIQNWHSYQDGSVVKCAVNNSNRTLSECAPIYIPAARVNDLTGSLYFGTIHPHPFFVKYNLISHSSAPPSNVYKTFFIGDAFARKLIAATTNSAGNVLLFLNDNTVVEVNVQSHSIQSSRLITTIFSGMTAAQTKLITAVIKRADGQKYYVFLSNGTYFRIDATRGSVDSGYPENTTSGWSGITSSQATSITGVFSNIADSSYYFFFKNGTYSRFNITDDRVDTGYPAAITNQRWGGWATYNAANVQAILRINNDAYLFNEQQ